jgi:hypothetical protein
MYTPHSGTLHTVAAPKNLVQSIIAHLHYASNSKPPLSRTAS